MSDSRISSLPAALSSLPVAFDAGQLTSDGGLVWLAQADDRVGLSAAFAAQVRDWRRGPVRHPLGLLLRQRLLQIACGYEDQDDADTLRHDPLLKLVCGRRPYEPTTDLASQPTLSRLENAVDRRACYRLAHALVAIYLQERERVAGGVPTHVLLDLDSTADPTHGAQEGSAYHGYYRQHMYHPLLVFDGHTNQLITPAHHRRPAPRDGACQPRRRHHLEAPSRHSSRPLAAHRHRAARRQWLRDPRPLRLLRTRADRLHDRPRPQRATGGAGCPTGRPGTAGASADGREGAPGG
jgi:hypothetical protein